MASSCSPLSAGVPVFCLSAYTDLAFKWLRKPQPSWDHTIWGMVKHHSSAASLSWQVQGLCLRLRGHSHSPTCTTLHNACLETVKQPRTTKTWWRHQMETFSALLVICAGNSPVPGEFPAQRPATRSFDVFFDLCLNKRLSKQSWGWWFETPSRSWWRHCYDSCFEQLKT